MSPVTKREWVCPRCDSIKPPKAYHCPDCKLKFDTEYNPIHPSYHMGSHDESPEYVPK